MRVFAIVTGTVLSASIAVACGGGPTTPGAVSPDEAKPMLAGDYELRLGEDDGACVVQWKRGDEDDGEVRMAVSPPCFFATEKSGAVTTRTFKDNGTRTAVIVVGSAEEQGDKRCGKAGQALILRSASVNYSERLSQNTTYCEGQSAPEEEFYKFTHE